jgi:hypothetical protein
MYIFKKQKKNKNIHLSVGLQKADQDHNPYRMQWGSETKLYGSGSGGSVITPGSGPINSELPIICESGFVRNIYGSTTLLNLRNFMFLSAGCSLLKAEGFFGSLDVLYVGQEIGKL